MVYPLTILVLIVIAVLSLMPVQELHLEGMTLSDKWAHSLMYGGLTAAVILERSVKKKKIAPTLWAVVLSFVYGGLMEILQAYCTNGNRSGDWLDFIANDIGAIIVYCLAWIIRLFV
ncbi:MAG: VanZ family protein [Bacteroidaceae bacterium]|nr:VanZ family protein [Bacteroidaceae bacterium]